MSEPIKLSPETIEVIRALAKEIAAVKKITELADSVTDNKAAESIFGTYPSQASGISSENFSKLQNLFKADDKFARATADLCASKPVPRTTGQHLDDLSAGIAILYQNLTVLEEALKPILTNPEMALGTSSTFIAEESSDVDKCLNNYTNDIAQLNTRVMNIAARVRLK